jgi:hypothetical protein
MHDILSAGQDVLDLKIGIKVLKEQIGQELFLACKALPTLLPGQSGEDSARTLWCR